MTEQHSDLPDLADVAARLAVVEMAEYARDAMLRYVDAADNRNSDAFPDVFTTDATLSFEQQSWVGLDEITSFFEANFAENTEQRRHFVTNLRVCDVTADHASGAAYFLFTTAMGPESSTVAWGRYEDQLQRVGQRALISSMRFHMDFVGDITNGWAEELARRVAEPDR